MTGRKDDLHRERLQKVLAEAGLGSRRTIESWIKAGRITIRGKPAKLGDKISNLTPVELDGQPVKIPKRKVHIRRVLMYNKPEGEICSRRDPNHFATIFDSLPMIERGRWLAIGRLDINTQGLLLLTTDGELAHRLQHPKYEIEREYAVRVLGEVDDACLKQLQKGIQLDDGPARFESIETGGGAGANRWFHVIVKEGRKREVRRLWEAVGLRVSRLIRVRYGSVTLPKGLARGRFRELSPDLVAALADSVGLGP